MLNCVCLCGRLTRDIELRYTQAGKAVGSFSLAVNRNFKNKDGEYEADFINCTIWGKSAENLANFVKKGSPINVTGHLNTRNYQNRQGQTVYITEVVVEHFDLLGSSKDNKSSGQSSNNSQSESQNNDQFANSGDATEIDDSKLPF